MSSRSLNRVELIGNLTRDPELKYIPNGTAVCTFGVATNRSWTTKNGDQKEEVQFHRIIAWQKPAELIAKLFTKGKRILIFGRITYRSYVAKDGTQKSITEIVLEDFENLDRDKKSEIGSSQASTKEVTEEKVHEEPAAHEFENATPVDDEKVNPDDIPF